VSASQLIRRHRLSGAPATCTYAEVAGSLHERVSDLAAWLMAGWLIPPCDVVGIVETYLGLVPGRPPATTGAFSKPDVYPTAKDEPVAGLLGDGEVAGT
jgi:hypothetical protein